ncbi:MAG: GIY-YIG nuclease family protein [Gemmatimonadaceae bacterium]
MPEAPGCYALTTASGDILYIGQAASLRQRLMQHWDSGRHKLTTVLGRISRVSVLHVSETPRLNAYERGWLNQCVLSDGRLPPLNRISAPV